MTAIVVLPEAERAEQDQRTERPERGHFAPRRRHGLPIRLRHQEGAEAIQEHVSSYPHPTAVGEGLRNRLRHLAFLIEVLGVRDRRLSGPDGIEDGREDLIPIEQQVHRVAPGNPRRGIGLDRRAE
jgi:hypothetical protein